MKEKKKTNKETKNIQKKSPNKNISKGSKNNSKSEKKPTTKKQITKESVKAFLTSYKFLCSVFAVLLVLVIILYVTISIKKNAIAKNYSNIVFSIMEKNTHNTIYIDLNDLVGNQYELKVTNYRNGKLNRDGATYTITVGNNTAAEIIVTKDDNPDNLMIDNELTKITPDPLSSTKKEETIYHISVKDGSKVKKGDKLSIEVES